MAFNFRMWYLQTASHPGQSPAALPRPAAGARLSILTNLKIHENPWKSMKIPEHPMVYHMFTTQFHQFPSVSHFQIGKKWAKSGFSSKTSQPARLRLPHISTSLQTRGHQDLPGGAPCRPCRLESRFPGWQLTSMAARRSRGADPCGRGSSRWILFLEKKTQCLHQSNDSNVY